MTRRDLFWRLFQVSGHVGAYLLYSWAGSTESGHRSDGGERDAGTLAAPVGEVNGSINDRDQEPCPGQAGG